MNAVMFGSLRVHTLLLFALFMLSQWGWWCFFGKHSNCNVFFLPSLTACFQITVLVCMGIFGQLLLGVYALLVLGIAYLPYFLLQKKNPLQFLPMVEFIYLLFVIIMAFCATEGKVLFDHDDFSHWGTVLKELLRTNHFPDSSRMMTEHFTYPLGSAVWIYFFSKALCANTDSAWMFGQALLILYCILPLFCFLPRQSGRIYPAIYILFLLSISICLFCYNTKIFALLVDTELPLVAAAGSLFAAFAGNPILLSPTESQDFLFSHSVWYLIPYLCALIQIKTSGIIFAIATMAILLLKPSMHTIKYRFLQIGVVFGASLVPLVLWRIYCSIHFSGMTAKHDGSLLSLIQTFSAKPQGFISDVFYRATKVFLTSNFFIEFSLIFVVAFFIALFISNDADFFLSAKSWCFLLGFYILYALSTIGMYIFSMPLNEAIRLASADRYQRTILIYCYYFLCCTILFSLSHINVILVRRDLPAYTGVAKKASTSLYDDSSAKRIPYTFVRINEHNRTMPRIYATRILILSVVLILFLSGWKYRNNGRFLTPSSYYSGGYMQTRLRCEDSLKEAGVPEQAKCLVLTTKELRVYKSLLPFLLGTDRNDVTQITVESPDHLQSADEALRNDTWVLVVDNENELIQAWLSQQENPHIVMIQ